MKLEDLLTTKKVVGLREVLRAADSGTLKKVLIAVDADDSFKEKILNATKQKGIEIVCMHTREQIGQACNIDIPAAVVGILIS